MARLRHHARPALAAALLQLVCVSYEGTAPAAAAEARAVDHYVLSLSWSPSFCASDAAADETLQCGSPRSYAFVLHGLWPQYVRGWPSYCDTNQRAVPERLFATVKAFMPSRRLANHQWRKHGSCSGLSMAGYFGLAAELFGKVRIPARYLAPTHSITTDADEIETDFAKTNRGLRPEMMTVTCSGHKGRARLQDVRICVTPFGEFTRCGRNEAQSCEASSLVLPPVRRARRPTTPDGDLPGTP